MMHNIYTHWSYFIYVVIGCDFDVGQGSQEQICICHLGQGYCKGNT